MFDLILLGASVRAAAWSARRADWTPLCLDLFGDLDLSRVAECRVIAEHEYPGGFLRLLQDTARRPLLYTGALENRPGLIARLAERFPLWGNGPEVLRRVRSPKRLRDALIRAHLPAPEVRENVPSAGRWLLKPHASGGGTGIVPWTGTSFSNRYCLQEWLDGWSWAAIYVGDRTGQARFLGATRQLVGEPWLHAAPFHYCGSVGPLALSEQQESLFVRIGQTLVSEFQLRGLFGVDGVMQNDIPYPVEVNPRYTASMEVIELVLGLPLLREHAAAFDPTISTVPARKVDDCVLGKCILFAESERIFPQEGPWDEFDADDLWAIPQYADIPRPGQKFRAAQPIMSLFATSPSIHQCLERLQQRVAEVSKQFASPP